MAYSCLFPGKYLDTDMTLLMAAWGPNTATHMQGYASAMAGYNVPGAFYRLVVILRRDV